MSTDPTQFPAGPKPLPSGPAPRPATPEDRNVRVTRVPDNMRDTRQPVNVRGEVVRAVRDPQTQETIVRVRTDRGEIEIRLPPEDIPPKEGQRVELTIQPGGAPGSPPERAVIRPAPVEAAETPRPIKTPVEISVRPATPPATTPDAPDTSIVPWPQPGSVVRLQPISSPEMGDQWIPEIVSGTISKAEFTAQIIVSDAQTEIIAQTLSIASETIPVAPPAVNTTPTPVTNFNAPAPALNIPQPLVAYPPLKALPSTQILGAAPVQNLLPLAPEFLAAPILTQPILNAPPLPLTTRTLPLDVKIEKIGQPEPVLTLPGQPPKSSGLIPNEQNIPAILKNQNAGAFTGIITGVTDTQLPVMNVFMPSLGGVQNFAIQAPVLDPPLAPGTQVQFTPQSPLMSTSAPQITLAQPLPPFSYFLTPGPWPAMDEIYQTLAHIAPPVAQAMTALTPAPANATQITPAALFFIAAIRGGDMASWLGDKAIDALKRDPRGGGLIARLTQEGGLLSRMAAEPISQDWRAVSLPFYWEGEFQKIALYFKRDEQGNEGNNQKGNGARFIFDLNLDQMGKVQIDGLFRPARLDVIVRTQSPFSQSMTQDMRATYARALRETGVTGELSFQNQPGQWVTITPEKQNYGATA